MARVFINHKNTCGKCYFTDGHVEDITHYTHYSEEFIVFNTESGRYEFRLWVEPVEYETVRADESPCRPPDINASARILHVHR